MILTVPRIPEKYSSIRLLIFGILVEPPTRTTSSICRTESLASSNAVPIYSNVFLKTGVVRYSNLIEININRIFVNRQLNIIEVNFSDINQLLSNCTVGYFWYISWFNVQFTKSVVAVGFYILILKVYYWLPAKITVAHGCSHSSLVLKSRLSTSLEL